MEKRANSFEVSFQTQFARSYSAGSLKEINDNAIARNQIYDSAALKKKINNKQANRCC